MEGNNEYYNIKKDIIWDVLNSGSTFDDFKSNINQKMYIKSIINEDIKVSIEIVQKLLHHSYFEYRFIDIAYNQAVSILEKAMKIKYYEINGIKTKMKLINLMQWFFDNNYFETWNDLVLHQHRSIRNIQLHNTEPLLGGTVFLRKLYNVIQHINDLYEDVNLRKIRKESTLELQKFFNELLTNNGGILTTNNRKIIHDISVIFIDNKLKNYVLTLAISEIFEIEKYINNSNYNPPITIFELKTWKIINDKFIATTTDNKSIIIEKNTNKINLDKFHIWLKQMYSSEENFMLLNYNSIFLNDLFSNCLTKLHKKL